MAKLSSMRCLYCREWAGWFTRTCVDCARLYAIYQTHRGQVGLGQFLDLLLATGLPRAKIEAFLAADPYGEGSIRDRIIADVSTELLAAMGVHAPQHAQEVKRLREKGDWRFLGERPKE